MTTRYSLTPIEIHQKRFNRSLRGYDRNEVREFLDRISQDLEGILVEKKKDQDLIAALNERLEEFKEREKTLRDTLVTAQKMSESMRASAQIEYDAIIAKAETEGEKILSDAHSKLNQVLNEIQDLKQQKIRLAASLHATLRMHYEVLSTSMKELPAGSSEPEEILNPEPLIEKEEIKSIHRPIREH